MNQGISYHVQTRTGGPLLKWETRREFDTFDEAASYAKGMRGSGCRTRVVVWSRRKFEMVSASLAAAVLFAALFVVLMLFPAINDAAPSAFVASGIGCIVCSAFSAWAFCLDIDSKALKEGL